MFAGLRQLLNEAHYGSIVRVIHVDRAEQLSLSVGDRLRVLNNDGAEHKKYVRCER